MKLNRKWLMVIALVLSLTMTTAGTLAFLTDRDTVENTFTMGNVDIEVEEEFEQNAPLNPGVEVEKQAGIKNTHATSDAWVWMTVSVPAELDKYLELGWSTGDYEKLDTPVHEGYVSYMVKHPDKLNPGDSTPKYLESVTLSEKVDYQEGAYVVVEDGKIVATIGDLSDVKVIVDGFAMQTDGFDTVDEAYDAYTEQWDGLNGGASGVEGGNFAGGEGTEDAPYLIKTPEQLMNISEYSDEYTYFKVADGVDTLDMTGIGKIALNGSFDGNGATLENLNTALFQYVGKSNEEQDIKISNFTANVHTTDGSALVKNILNPGTTTFENVTLHGYIEGQYNMGSFYNYGAANSSDSDGANYTVNFKNAKSDVTLVCTTGNAIGGMLGHGYEGANYQLSVNMDDDSGYTGEMYTTGTATCYEVMAMCSHATYMLNGTEVSRYEGTYPSTRLTKVVPTLESDGYYVAPVDGVDHYVVYINSQLTAYDTEGNKIANKAGMTWNLGKKTINAEGVNGKIFDSFTSAEIVNGTNHDFGYALEDGVLKIYSARSDNYASGWVTLQVNQYAADDTLLATGIITVHTFPEP